MNDISRKIKVFSQPQVIVEIVFLALSVGMGIYFQWELMNLFFFLIFLHSIIHPIPSRIPAGVAVALLILTALLLVFKKSDWAEMTAVWAYYSMILILVMEVGETRCEDIEHRT